MRFWLPLLVAIFAAAGPTVAQQRTAGDQPPRIDERVAQIPQTALGAPWAFIGFAVTTPTEPQWFVATSTPRGGSMGRHLSANDAHTAVLVLSSEILNTPVDTDNALLELARARHAKLSERWQIGKHEETVVRHAGTRCARHTLEAKQLEDTSPRKSAAKRNALRDSMFVSGISCVHPTDLSMLIEVGISERGQINGMSSSVARDAEQAIASLGFHRFNEQALQKSAEAARTTGLADAEAVLKPYVDADAAWARYFLAQIIERARPAPDNASVRIRALLEPAAEKGLADAQWSLGALYLRGAPGVPKDPSLAEAFLRRAAERGNAGAAFQLGIAQLSGADGIAANTNEGALWVQRAAVRGLKEAQEMLKGTRDKPAQK
ncbi:MAG: tetratricopeptide repeat protein [Burkholderiaceae bacterium]